MIKIILIILVIAAGIIFYVRYKRNDEEHSDSTQSIDTDRINQLLQTNLSKINLTQSDAELIRQYVGENGQTQAIQKQMTTIDKGIEYYCRISQRPYYESLDPYPQISYKPKSISDEQTEYHYHNNGYSIRLIINGYFLKYTLII